MNKLSTGVNSKVMDGYNSVSITVTKYFNMNIFSSMFMSVDSRIFFPRWPPVFV